ncbi:MAG: hypothetical protein D6835_03795, partial [Candidatus Thermofonsia bacterium]
MMDFEQIQSYLQQWQRRRKVRDALLWLPRGLLFGLLTAVLAAVFARLRPFLTNTELLYTTLSLAAAGLAAAIVWLLAQRPTLVQQARFADAVFGLKERVSTAVELHNGQLTAPPEIAHRQLQDTLKQVTAVDPSTALPYQLHKQDWLILLLTTILLAAAILLPNPQENTLLKQRAIQQEIEAQKNTLQALAEEIEKNPDLTEAQQEQLLEPIQNALQELDQSGVGQEAAVAALSEAEAELRDLAQAADQTSLREALQNAGQPLAENNNAASLGQALQNGNLFDAASAAAQLADQLPELSPEEQAALAEDLAETAASLQNIDSELAQD